MVALCFTCTSSVYRGTGSKKHENYKSQTAKSLFLASDLKLQNTILSKVKTEQSLEIWLNSYFSLFRIRCEVFSRYPILLLVSCGFIHLC